MKLQEIAKAINSAKRVAIMGHKGGDTDCYGAAFGLASGLEKIGKRVEVVVEAEFPESLNFLFFYFSGDVVQTVHDADLLIIIDTPDLSRTADSGLVGRLKESSTKVVQLDHHILGDLAQFADLPFTDLAASSTSEIVLDLIDILEVEIDKNIATCLLSGIIGDTSSFQNQNTTKKSFAAASELMKRGARLTTIINHTFGGKEVDVLKVWGLAMERLVVDERHSVVSTYLTYEDIESYGLSADAISGIVNFLNQVKGAKVVMLITEEEKGIVKVSLRTRDDNVDVAKIARQLGGGGHVKAAGFSFPGSLKILTGTKNNHIVVV